MLRSIDYERGGPGKSLYDLWDEGGALETRPLSVVSQRYRDAIVNALTRWVQPPACLISLGCGCGFTELALARAGYRVLATDLSPSAVASARRKGLQARCFDVIGDTITERWQIVYADGLLGHLWVPDRGLAPAITATRRLLATGGVVVVANDLADSDDECNLAVSSDPQAEFFRPPRDYLYRAFNASGRVVDEVVFHYRRPSGAPRRRQVLVAY